MELHGRWDYIHPLSFGIKAKPVAFSVLAVRYIHPLSFGIKAKQKFFEGGAPDDIHPLSFGIKAKHLKQAK